MINRLRSAWRRARAAVGRAGAGVCEVFDKEDVLMLVGLGLVASGLWELSHAAALAIPGGILVWIFLPSRPPFFDAPSARGRRSPS